MQIGQLGKVFLAVSQTQPQLANLPAERHSGGGTGRGGHLPNVAERRL